MSLNVSIRFFISMFLLWQCCPSGSVTEINPSGDVLVCPGDESSFTCDVINGGSLTWTITPHDETAQYIIFLSSAHMPGAMGQAYGSAVVARLDTILAQNVSSTLTINTTRINNKLPLTIGCNRQFDGPTSNLILTEPPSAPVDLVYSNKDATTPNSSTTCVQLTWSPPLINSNVDHYYILTITPSPSTLTQPLNITTNTTVDIILLYDTTYNISVRAINCAGPSTDTAELTVYINSTPEVESQCPLPESASHDLDVTDTVPTISTTKPEGSVMLISCDGVSWNITCTASGWLPELTECQSTTLAEISTSTQAMSTNTQEMSTNTVSTVLTSAPSLLFSAGVIGIIAGSSSAVLILFIILAILLGTIVILIGYHKRKRTRKGRQEPLSHDTQGLPIYSHQSGVKIDGGFPNISSYEDEKDDVDDHIYSEVKPSPRYVEPKLTESGDQHIYNILENRNEVKIPDADFS